MDDTRQDDRPTTGHLALILYRLDMIEQQTRQLVSLPLYKMEQAAVKVRISDLEAERAAGRTARRALWTGAAVAVIAPSFTLIFKLLGGM